MPQDNKIKIRRGLNSNLPAANTEVGELRYSTDTKELYIDDGTNNIKIGGNPLGFPVSTATQTALDGKASSAAGVPAGGTTGQVLRKKTNTSYDTEWGTGGVTYGTTAGTACEGNDGRISGIGSGTINTGSGGGSIDTRGVGYIELGNAGTRTTIVGGATTVDRNISLPDLDGTLALTQQTGDYEVTDATKGVILKSPNNLRWRITIDNDGNLSSTKL